MSNPAESFAKTKGKIAIAKRIAIREAAKQLLKIIPELIKYRTRSGASATGSLKSLAESTKEYRKRYSSNLSSETSPGESNLTATGQLLDAIIGKATDNGLTFTINRKKRKGELSGGKSDLTNEEVRKYVEQSREFLLMGKEDLKEAIELASDIIKEEYRKAFK